ncbi:MAG: hypothetical protein WCJ40_01010 [Planctomycetota bacterium]
MIFSHRLAQVLSCALMLTIVGCGGSDGSKPSGGAPVSGGGASPDPIKNIPVPPKADAAKPADAPKAAAPAAAPVAKPADAPKADAKAAAPKLESPK